ncbi:MAG: hypothetical protein QOD34_222 [Mycobacterium sp.]|nr:hypothetical protein [Mycobacterium sp.]
MSRADSYAARVDGFVAPHAKRARVGQAHPVWDFLFTYYSLRPGQLRCWHPGYGVALAGDEAIRRYRNRRGYAVGASGVTVSCAYLLSRRETIAYVARLLRATARRPAKLNCFGLHEWAMVYRSGDVRHDRVPLRLGAAGTDTVVEAEIAGPLRCSHYDAFRFFSADAAPRNAGAPSRATQHDWEQPGCLHANMDLYKWSYKLSPLIESDIVMDAFELAYDARELDMRASPYDLTALGFQPVRIETPSGRAEYVRRQALLAERAAVVRQALLDWCQRLLEAASVDQR